MSLFWIILFPCQYSVETGENRFHRDEPYVVRNSRSGILPETHHHRHGALSSPRGTVHGGKLHRRLIRQCVCYTSPRILSQEFKTDDAVFRLEATCNEHFELSRYQYSSLYSIDYGARRCGG